MRDRNREIYTSHVRENPLRGAVTEKGVECRSVIGLFVIVVAYAVFTARWEYSRYGS